MNELLDRITPLVLADPRYQERRAAERQNRIDCPFELAPTGASDAELAAAELALGAALPPSYRAFLARWNGSHPASGHHRLLSIAEVVALARSGAAPFLPHNGRAVRTGTVSRCDPYYADKPAHWLFIYAHAWGKDGTCLELSRGDADPALRIYDPHEIEWLGPTRYWLSRFAHAAYPAFDALVMEHVFNTMDANSVHRSTMDAAVSIFQEMCARRGWARPWET